jgi:glycosyltransferase involved in cell wall biosynthesis
MRIGLNLLHATPEIGGGWNYIRNVVAMIQACDTDHEYVAYCTKESESLVRETANCRKVLVAIRGSNRFARILYENTMLHRRARRDAVDVMYWFANACSLIPGARNLVTVHDLLALEQPQVYSWLRRVYTRWMLPHSARRATVVMPVSDKTASDLTRMCGVERERMVVLRNPLGPAFHRASAEQVLAFRREHGLPDAMWLYVAHYYPHKNHRRLFDAYSRLEKTRPQGWALILCGNKNGHEREIAGLLREFQLEDRVIWLRRLADAEMPVLYSAASAVIFPSLYEGGGIPVMEAMSCGCPVVASDIPTTREFAGDAALLFDPLDVDAIARAMSAFESDGLLRETFRQRGLQVAEDYRMDKIFTQLLAAYEKTALNNNAA